MGTATAQVNSSVAMEISTERPIRSPIKSRTGFRHSKEYPKSPWRKFHAHRKYWT